MQLNLYFIVWYDNTVFPDVLGLKHLPPPSSSPAQVWDGVARVHSGQPSDWTGGGQWPNMRLMLQTVDMNSCSPAWWGEAALMQWTLDRERIVISIPLCYKQDSGYGGPQVAPEGGSHLKAENICWSFQGWVRLMNSSEVTGAYGYFQTESSRRILYVWQMLQPWAWLLPQVEFEDISSRFWDWVGASEYLKPVSGTEIFSDWERLPNTSCPRKSSKCYKHSKVLPVSNPSWGWIWADFEPSAIEWFCISQTWVWFLSLSNMQMAFGFKGGQQDLRLVSKWG